MAEGATAMNLLCERAAIRHGDAGVDCAEWAFGKGMDAALSSGPGHGSEIAKATTALLDGCLAPLP